MKLNKKFWMGMLHYAIVFGVLAFSWTGIMDYFGGELIPTLATGFAVLVVADQLVHKFLLKEKTLLEG